MRIAGLILALSLLCVSWAWGESQEGQDRYNRGVICQSQGRLEEAISEYQKAIALEPRYGWAWSNLSNVSLSLEKVEEAIQCFHKAMGIDRQDPTLMERGFANLEFIEKEPDLARRRGDPCYQELLARQTNKQNEPPPAKSGQEPER